MSDGPTPLALLVNPAAGGGRAKKVLPAVEEYLDAMHAPFRVERTRDAEHGVSAALAAAEAGEIPVVVSGDGLIGAVGGALAGGDTPLGVVPCGRGNDLARVLGIPTDPQAAAELLLSGSRRRIDVGEANGVPFLCIASTGFDARANQIANEARLIRGPLVYAYAALRALATWRPAKFHLVAGGERWSVVGYSVIVANSQAYGGGMFVAPEARLDDGEFDLLTIGEVSKLRFLANLPKVFKGEHLANEEVELSRARTVELSASRPMRVYADGEWITDLPVKLRVRPAALEVICPPGEE